MIRVRLLAVAAAACLGAGTAQAARYNFSYALVDGSIIHGALLGTVQADANLVIVDGIVGQPTIDGIAFPEISVVTSYRAWNDLGVFVPGTVSFDGSVVDVLIANTAIDQGFGLQSGLGPNDPGYVVAILGNVPHFDSFRAADWSLTAAVPEPGTWTLMLTGFGLAGTALRRRSVQPAA